VLLGDRQIVGHEPVHGEPEADAVERGDAAAEDPAARCKVMERDPDASVPQERGGLREPLRLERGPRVVLGRAEVRPESDERRSRGGEDRSRGNGSVADRDAGSTQSGLDLEVDPEPATGGAAG
jgi:hypothetical protein